MASGKKVRIWVDGCFDLFHYGHANALRQSRALGDILVAGCHSDEAIERNKGPPVLPQSDRFKLLAACRWVDEVVPDAPYNTEVDFVKQHKIDFVAHGDDLTTDANGLDTYRFVKHAGIYREFQRTGGVSTTDAIARILFRVPCALPGPQFDLAINLDLVKAFALDPGSSSVSNPAKPFITRIDIHSTSDLKSIRESDEALPSYRPTEHDLVCTSAPGPDETVVYVHGTFDLFSVKDLDYFQAIGQNGKFKVIVGVWAGDDARLKLARECILSFQERVLGVLQCRYISGVVVPAVPPEKLPFKLQASHFRPDNADDTILNVLSRQDTFVKRQIRKQGKAVVEKLLEEAQNPSLHLTSS